MKINSKIIILNLALMMNLALANEPNNLSVELKEITKTEEIDDDHKLYDIEPIEDHQNPNDMIVKMRKRESDEIIERLKKEQEIENFLAQDYKVKQKDKINFVNEAFNAAKNGDLENLKFLINKNLVNINQLNKEKTNLLIVATLNNQIDVVEFLLSKRININAKEKDKNGTALHIAYKYNYLDIADLLIDYGANIHMKDEFGNYPDDYKNLNDSE